MTITVSGRDYAVGLTWDDELKASRPHVYIKHEEHGTSRDIYGMGGKDDGGIPSLAYICTSFSDEGLFVAKSDNGDYWSCIVMGGLVVPDTDKLFETEDDFVSYIDTESDVTDIHYAVGLPMPEVSIMGVVEVPDDVDKYVLLEKESRKEDIIKLFVVLLILGVMGGGYWGYQKWQEHKAEVASIAAIAAAKRAQQQKIIERRGTLQNQSATMAEKAIDIINNMPIYISGWKIMSTNIALPSGSMTLSLGNDNGNTDNVIQVLKGMSKRPTISFTGDGRKINVRTSVNITSKPDETKKLGDLNTIVKRVYNLSNVHRYNIHFNTLPTAQNPGKWSVSLNTLKDARVFVRKINKIDGIDFTLIEFAKSKVIVSGQALINN